MQLPVKSFAMVQTAKRQLTPTDVEIPEIDDDSAILKLEACGICGSDYEQFEDVLRTPMPVIPGHEPLGVIAKIGDNAAARWGVDDAAVSRACGRERRRGGGFARAGAGG